MAHLGTDVAAYVDGQLSESAARDADAHLLLCSLCEKAVRQQRLMKSRVSTVGAPQPSSALMAALAGLSEEPPRKDGWLDRFRRATAVGVGLVLVGASLMVVAMAYAVGAEGDGEIVRPAYEEYVADFLGAGSVVTASTIAYTDADADALQAQGWPCHATLGTDLRRVATQYDPTTDVIRVGYAHGTTRLRLYEQPGTLDPDDLEGFERRTWRGQSAWVSVGDPTVLTWSDGGVVYTVVTDASWESIEQAVAQLPAQRDPSAWRRVDDGLHRMASAVGV